MNNEKDNKKAVSAVIVSVAFIAVIVSLFVASFFVRDKAFSDNENRELAQAPDISLEGIVEGSFTDGFEAYVQDQFPGRNGFMALKTGSEKALGKGDNGLVYFGDKGYLFSIEEIDMQQLEKNLSYIEKFSGEAGVETKILVAPTASYILNDKLPGFIDNSDEKEAFDIIKSSAKAGFIDVRGSLEEHSGEYIYYKTDHHWTTLGAFYAYNEIMEEDRSLDEYKKVLVSDEFLGTNYSKAMLPSIEADCIYRYDLAEDDSNYEMSIYEAGKKTESFEGLYDEKYLEMKDKYSYFLSGNNPVTVIESDVDSKDKSILVVKDSFAHCFIPFLANDYDRIVAVDMRYYRNGLKGLIDEYHIDEVLFLYNVINLSNDTNLVFINR